MKNESKIKVARYDIIISKSFTYLGFIILQK